MQEIKSNFNGQLMDVEEYLSFLSFIDTHSKLSCCVLAVNMNEFPTTSSLLKILKSNCFLIFYNLIEATVYRVISRVHEEILEEGVCYADASAEIRSIWSSNINNKKLKKVFDNIIDEHPLELTRPPSSISGSVDIRKIRLLLNAYGIGRTLVESSTTTNSFLKVKNRRNKLAHGEVPYSSASSDTTLSDFQRISKDIKVCLESFIDISEQFLLNEEYRGDNAN